LAVERGARKQRSGRGRSKGMGFFVGGLGGGVSCDSGSGRSWVAFSSLIESKKGGGEIKGSDPHAEHAGEAGFGDKSSTGGGGGFLMVSTKGGGVRKVPEGGKCVGTRSLTEGAMEKSF